MSHQSSLLQNMERIRGAASTSDDGQRCAVAPAPELREKIQTEMNAIRAASTTMVGTLARTVEPTRAGLNDGLIVPPENFPLGTPLSVIRNVAADRAPLRGTLRVIVVLVDFTDKHMVQTQAHFRDLFFSTGVIPTKSVREYYREVTHGLIDIQGDVIGPLRLPMTLAQYAHGAAGMSAALPNAQTMARDAAIAADPLVNFNLYDNDGNGFVDAFIVVHAGSGGEVTGNPGDIWSHKWVLDGGARMVDSTKIYAYLTVPEDSKIGVCCHELGHLLFGFPDLYDTDSSSEGIGDWCLMAAGSWGGGGNTPVHPSAWCKANQGWVSIDNHTVDGNISIPDVKDSNTVLRLWNNGGPGSEYFLVENRQKNRFDASLPGSGLLIWHIDDAIGGNTNESHYKVALMQADGKRDLELNHNRGDAGDSYPGTSGNANFHNTSTPNSKSYGGVSTCVSLTGISASAAVMTAHVGVHCKTIEKNRLKEFKDTREKRFEKFPENKLNEGGRGGLPLEEARLTQLETRIAALEAALVSSGMASATGPAAAPEPFIGAELRPDLTASALSAESDYSGLQDLMEQGSAPAKRLYDTKQREQ